MTAAAVTLSNFDIDDRWRPWWLAVLASAEYKLSGIGNSKAREAVRHGLRSRGIALGVGS